MTNGCHGQFRSFVYFKTGWRRVTSFASLLVHLLTLLVASHMTPLPLVFNRVSYKDKKRYFYQNSWQVVSCQQSASVNAWILPLFKNHPCSLTEIMADLDMWGKMMWRWLRYPFFINIFVSYLWSQLCYLIKYEMLFICGKGHETKWHARS